MAPGSSGESLLPGSRGPAVSSSPRMRTEGKSTGSFSALSRLGFAAGFAPAARAPGAKAIESAKAAQVGTIQRITAPSCSRSGRST
ncbi:hypothetical protein D3C87_1767830 [compost metagenome]